VYIDRGAVLVRVVFGGASCTNTTGGGSGSGTSCTSATGTGSGSCSFDTWCTFSKLFSNQEPDTGKKNTVLGIGLVFLLGGGVVAAMGMRAKK
jgi:hypothetical protein